MDRTTKQKQKTDERRRAAKVARQRERRAQRRVASGAGPEAAVADRQRYHKVQVRIWNDAKFRELNPFGKLAFLYLLTHPSMLSFGAMRGNVPGLAAELAGASGASGASDGLHEAFTSGFNQAFTLGMAQYDPAGLVALPNFIRHNPPGSPNVVRAWGRLLEMLPECALLTAHMSLVRKHMQDMGEAYEAAFSEAFGEGAFEASEAGLTQASLQVKGPSVNHKALNSYLKAHSSEGTKREGNGEDTIAAAPEAPSAGEPEGDTVGGCEQGLATLAAEGTQGTLLSHPHGPRLEVVGGEVAITLGEVAKHATHADSGRKVSLADLRARMVEEALRAAGCEPPSRAVVNQWIRETGSAAAVTQLVQEMAGAGKLQGDGWTRYLYGAIKRAERVADGAELDACQLLPVSQLSELGYVVPGVGKGAN